MIRSLAAALATRAQIPHEAKCALFIYFVFKGAAYLVPCVFGCDEDGHFPRSMTHLRLPALKKLMKVISPQRRAHSGINLSFR